MLHYHHYLEKINKERKKKACVELGQTSVWRGNFCGVLRLHWGRGPLGQAFLDLQEFGCRGRLRWGRSSLQHGFFGLQEFWRIKGFCCRHLTLFSPLFFYLFWRNLERHFPPFFTLLVIGRLNCLHCHIFIIGKKGS